jgi:hypothetical protein
MKTIAVTGTAILCLLFGVAAPVSAAQEQHGQQEEQKAQPARQDEKTQHPKAAKPEEKTAPQRQNKAQQAKPSAQHAQSANQKPAPQQNKTAKQPAAQQNNNAKQNQTARQQHTQQAKPAQQPQRASSNRGGRIPDDRYRANFGRQHTFRVSQGDYSNRRFQYGGYSFGFVGAWPGNWLYTQDVFVVDIDGVYYLCNPAYPGVNIALSVVL